MRDDCPDQYHAEGSLCGQRSSRGRLSRVSIGSGRSVPGGGIGPFGRGKPSADCVYTLVSLDTTPKVKEQQLNLVSTIQCSLVVHAYRTPRARP